MAEAEKYEVLEKIGHGSFGVIRKVRRKADGHILCRKEISYLQMSAREREQLQAELSILKGLRHPNIVAYYEREHIKAASDLHIYMEYCEHGDLGRYVKDLKRSGKMADEDFVWSVFTQMITALYRCHYGEDAPEVGRNVMGLSSDAKPLKSKAPHAMILHRDLKPENIFLGSDASAKLGDFGLSKIMQSHDFASTYVGTPFYMSPEICAAEQYSLHSDIWALGCIMYELCAKEPPFNAKTHLELIQRIRLGKITPLSHIYSPELKETISRCLRVNPMTRPDTSQLLNIPMVKLKRKELEIVRVGKHLKAREEQAAKAMKDAERRLAQMNADKHATRLEIDQAVRREWEVKARLEIDRQVQQGMERLYKGFESEVSKRVEEEFRKYRAARPDLPQRSMTPGAETLPQDIPLPNHHQSQSTSGETDDFPSSTDLSELSLESPIMAKAKLSAKGGRTPFARAQTMFDGSPDDIQMADPSPAPIASLNLSPRRNGGAQPSSLRENIFATADRAKTPIDESADEADDDEDADDVPALPSPTRAKAQNGDPFKTLGTKRPPLIRQKTAPQKSANQSHHFAVGFKGGNGLTREQSQHALGTAPYLTKPSKTSTSPARRMSKLPSATNLISDAGSPQRKTVATPSTSPNRLGAQQHNHAGLPRPPSRRKGGEDDIRQAAMANNHVQGRTLIELAQARVNPAGVAVQDFGENPTAIVKGGSGGISKDQEDSIGSEDKAPMSANVTVWDPERDEMPSPFLVRARRGIISEALGTGAPGMRHLR